MEELEKVEAPIEYAWGLVGHLMGVMHFNDSAQSLTTRT